MAGDPSWGHITENARTLESAESLRRGDIERVGELMNESHASLRDDMEVSGPELDAAVGLSQEAGCLGSRMTGAGFAGCAMALVPSASIDVVLSRVRATNSIAPYPTTASAGVEVM